MQSPLQLTLSLLRAGRDPGLILTYLELGRSLRGCRSILDVGCGSASPLQLFGCARLVGIEGYAPSYETAKRTGTHHELVLGDIRNLDRFFRPGQFEACVAIDVIEHLDKADGLKLIRAMESVASKRVVFFTPNDFLPQSHGERHDLQEHLSGWTAAEMRQLGYRVRGMLGPRSLRGSYHILKYRPRVFWGTVSLLGQLFWTRRNASRAAAILCVKSAAAA